MKKFLLISFCFTYLSFICLAQEDINCKRDDIFGNEKMKIERSAFFTERINFTITEAQAFWPIYNECETKVIKLIDEEHNLLRELKNNLDGLSDKEVEAKLNRIIQLRIEKGEIEKSYHKQYEAILSPKKIALFYNADRDFRKQLMHKHRPPRNQYNRP